jgi:hypothetical protein
MKKELFNYLVIALFDFPVLRDEPEKMGMSFKDQ